jgi:hypothetical protein
VNRIQPRHIFTLLLACPFLLPLATAQVPALIHYQGRLVDGTHLANGSVALNLHLFSAPAGGVLLYTDSNPAVTVVDGLYSTYIGDNTTYGNLEEALAEPEVWLEVEVDATTLTPRERLVAVPYARAVHGLFIRPEKNSVTLNPDAGGNTALGSYATVGGGHENRADGEYSVVSGGQANEAVLWHGTIGGGNDNFLAASFGTIGGGRTNIVTADYGTIAGGWNNTASGSLTFIGGGQTNVASGLYSTIGGGARNAAEGTHSTIAGGSLNWANGNYAMIPGGLSNSATNFAFAAGRRARANHEGSFVWADSSNAHFSTTTNNQFLVRAGGGVGINTNQPQATLHVAGDAIIGDNPEPAEFGMQRVNTNLSGTLFTHTDVQVTMMWDALARTLTVSNAAPHFVQASISLMRNGTTNVAFVVEDLPVAAFSELASSASSDATSWTVHATGDARPGGFTFQGGGFGPFINGLVTYWR